MDMNQPTAQTQVFNSYKKPPGLFAGKIPSSVSFIVAILLLLLPFAEIRCGSTPLVNKSGLDFALQKEWKPAGGYGKEFLGNMTSKSTGKTEANSRWFAIAALALGILGLLTCLAAPRSATAGSVFGRWCINCFDG